MRGACGTVCEACRGALKTMRNESATRCARAPIFWRCTSPNAPICANSDRSRAPSKRTHATVGGVGTAVSRTCSEGSRTIATAVAARAHAVRRTCWRDQTKAPDRGCDRARGLEACSISSHVSRRTGRGYDDGRSETAAGFITEHGCHDLPGSAVGSRRSRRPPRRATLSARRLRAVRRSRRG